MLKECKLLALLLVSCSGCVAVGAVKDIGFRPEGVDIDAPVLERTSESCRIEENAPAHAWARVGRPASFSERKLAPLHIAVMGKSLGEVRRLLQKPETNVDVRDALGETPLHKAAELNEVAIVHELVRHGASVNARDSLEETPLNRAAGLGSAGVVRELLATQGIDVNAKNILGRTALEKAIKNNNHEIVQMIREYMRR